MREYRNRGADKAFYWSGSLDCRECRCPMDSRRSGRERQRWAALAGLTRAIFGALTSNGIAHPTKQSKNLLKLAADRGCIMMELQLASGDADAPLTNAVMVGFPPAMSDLALSGDFAGYAITRSSGYGGSR